MIPSSHGAPLLVVGASRSGTTMLNRILSGHPSILALNELHYFGDLVPSPSTRSSYLKKTSVDLMARLLARARRGIWGELPTPDEYCEAGTLFGAEDNDLDSIEMFQRVLSHLGETCASSYTTDQTPRNILYAYDLLAKIPELRVVQMVRDPRAVLFSQKQRWRKRWLGDKSIPLHNALRVWVNYHPIIMSRLWNRAALCGMKLRNDPRFMLIKYEDVVADPQRQIGMLCDFLDLDFVPEMLNVEAKGSSHSHLNKDHRGVSTGSLELWREGLSLTEIKVCETLSGDLMGQLSYDATLPENQHQIPRLAYLSYPLHLCGAALMNPRRVLALLS